MCIFPLALALALAAGAFGQTPYVRLGIDSNHVDMQALSFSSDGRFFLAIESTRGTFDFVTKLATYEDGVRTTLWDMATGRAVHRFDGKAIFSPDGAKVLSWGKQGTLLDIASGEEVRHFEGAADRFAFSPDGLLIYARNGDEPLRILDAMTGQEYRRIEKMPMPDSISPGGNWFVVRGATSFWLVNAINPQEDHQLAGHTGQLTSSEFSEDGKFILTAGMDKTARLWDASTGTQIRQFDHKEGVVIAQFVPGKREIVTVQVNKVADLFDLDSGVMKHEFDFRSDGPVLTYKGTEQDDYGNPRLAFSSDGKLMAASGSAGALWRLSDGVKMASFNHGGPMAFSRDSRFFLMGDSGNADLWNLITGKVVRRYGPEDFFSRAAYGLALSPNGGTLVALAGPAAHLWDLNIGAEIHPFGERTLKSGVRDEPAGSSVAFSPDGKSILSGPAYDQRLDGPGLKKDTEWVKLWDLASLAVTRHFPLLVEDINPSGGGKVAISANGRYAAASQTNAVTVWDLANDKEVRRLVVPVVTELAGGGSGTRVIFDNFDALAISGDGRRVVTGINDNIVRLWDTGTGEQIRKFEGHTRTIRAADMTPDGKLAITGSEDKTARLWSLDDGRATCTFAGHSGSVTAVAFSPSAKFAATGSADATARLWDVTTCREVMRFEGHTDTVNAVAFSPDGKHLFTACEDSTINIWDTSSGKLLATIVNFPEGWAVTDPEGRYDASDPDRSPTLYWLVGLDVIELGQLKQRFYTPGLLGKIMRGEPLPSVAGLRDIKRVPDVDVTAPEEGSTETSVELINRGGGIGRLIVKVNGREVPNATRGAAPDPNAAVGAVKIDLAGATLSPTGKNVIEVFADSGDGVIRSRGVTVEWDRQPPKEAQPRLFAIIAGVSQYDSSALNLRYPSKDALDFGHALQLAAKGLFGDRASITILGSGTNLEPTKENLRNAFDKVAKEAHSGDLLVVYLAGHGVAARVEHDQYYFLTKEARSFDIDRDSGLREFSTLSSAELKEWLSRKNMPLKQVIILDTCAAGAALDEMVKLADRRSLSPDQIRAIELLKDSTGSWVLMGSAADAVSYEANKYAQGLLTYALLEGMKGAALDGDQVEVSKLFGFAQRQVEDLSRGIGGLQRPVLSAPKGQTFPIGLLTLIDREKIHLASAKPELLRARVHDEDDLDSLKLEPAVRADLRANSMPAAPGSPQHDPEIAYLDSVVDEVPDALIPLIRYSVEGQSLKVRLRLLRNGKPVWDRNLELAGTDAEKASQQLATEIVAAAEKVD